MSTGEIQPGGGNLDEAVAETLRESEPFYCVQDPETDQWWIVLYALPQYVRAGILDKVKGPEFSEDWHELRSPVWASHMLHMQAEEGDEEAAVTLKEDRSKAIALLPGDRSEWNEFIWGLYQEAGHPPEQ